MKSTIYVRFDLTVGVELPEFSDDGSEDELTEEYRSRAIDAATSAISQHVDVFIDGEDSPPANVDIDISDDCVEEVWIE